MGRDGHDGVLATIGDDGGTQVEGQWRLETGAGEHGGGRPQGGDAEAERAGALVRVREGRMVDVSAGPAAGPPALTRELAAIGVHIGPASWWVPAPPLPLWMSWVIRCGM